MRQSLLSLGLLLSACGGGAGDPAAARGSGRPNVLLVTIESLRPDHVASFGGPRATCPNLDGLAAEGMVYPDAHSVTSWTLASHASLFTGLYPTTHRVVQPLGRLDDSYVTLAERLGERGYQCAGVVSGPYLREEHNLNQGFELYDSSPSEDQGEAHGDVTSPEVEAALRRFLLEQRDPDRPFFLFAYLWDPHYDYIPPAPFDASFVDDTCAPIDCRGYATTRTVNPGTPAAQMRWVKAQYDGEILWTDAHLGRIFDLLREQGLWDDTLVIVTGDHGEEFFEHGNKGHKHNLHVEQVHVPLVVKYPRGGPTGRDERLASLVDVVPTVLDVTGAETRDPLQGRSLLAPADPDRTILLELLAAWYTVQDEDTKADVKHWYGLRRGDEKLLFVPEDRRLSLYDVRRDPWEQDDLAPREPERAKALLETFDAWFQSARELGATFDAASVAPLSPEALERLRSLGYVR